MSLSKICAATLVAVGLSLLAAAPAQAALVNFDVDPAQSYARLTIPDFNYAVDVLGTINVRPRNFNVNNNNAWVDSGGRLAPLDGTIATNLVDGVSVQFLTGANNLFAVETFNARPNPAVFNGVDSYTNTSTALAAFATNIRTNNFLVSQFGLLAMRDVQMDMQSGVLALGGGTNIAAGATNLGLESVEIGLDAVGLAASALDDILTTITSNDLFANAGGGTITVVDPLTRKLTLTVNMPLVFDLDGVILNGSVTGQIVAFATLVPEPSTIAMAGIAALGLCFAGRRRFRRS